MTVKVMKPLLSVVLVDLNPQVTQAWRTAFADTPEVHIVRGSILAQEVDAWVTPTNSRGRMDGGVDSILKQHFGSAIERRVQREIAERFGGRLPVGAATCVPTGLSRPGYLISTPTMTRSAEDVRETLNVALACAAAFQAIHMQNDRLRRSIRSVAIPGLGAGTGRLSPRVCANLMWTGYTLFNDFHFEDFDALRRTLTEHLADFEEMEEDTRVRIHVPEFGVFPSPPRPF
jgi:O-acetyl-ADP-ribose deacetylase (regulator of RNase III)